MHISPEKREDTGRSPTPAAITPMSCLIRRPVTPHAFVLGVGASSGQHDGQSWESVHRALCREVQSFGDLVDNAGRVGVCHRASCQSPQCEQRVAVERKPPYFFDLDDFLSPELDISFLRLCQSLLDGVGGGSSPLLGGAKASAPLLSRGFLVDFSVGVAREPR
jgi:hypothetical protein